MEIENYLSANEGTSNPLTEWKVFKAVIRGALIIAIAAHWAELLTTRISLEGEVATRVAAFVSNSFSEHRDALIKVPHIFLYGKTQNSLN